MSCHFTWWKTPPLCAVTNMSFSGRWEGFSPMEAVDPEAAARSVTQVSSQSQLPGVKEEVLTRLPCHNTHTHTQKPIKALSVGLYRQPVWLCVCVCVSTVLCHTVTPRWVMKSQWSVWIVFQWWRRGSDGGGWWERDFSHFLRGSAAVGMRGNLFSGG